jgi:hypothetical protein
MGLPLGFPALAAGMTGSALYGIKRVAEGEEKRKNAGKNKREADAEMKRESRGVEKPANFDAIEEAKQEAKDSATAKKQDKAYNESLTTENKAKGGIVGSASKRADGIATRGKTNCKMY